MGEYDFLEKLKNEEAILFKRCIRKLLDVTFIIEDRDEKLYQYIAIDSNYYDISSYLQVIGYDVIIEKKLKVAMLVQNEEDIDTIGIRRSNLIQFDKKQFHILLILWLIYLERVGFSEAIYSEVGDIIDKLKAYGVEPSQTEFKSALKLFKKYSLIDFSGQETSENSKVRLYPTLQFCMNIAQMKQVMQDYLPKDEFDLQQDADFDDKIVEEM